MRNCASHLTLLITITGQNCKSVTYLDLLAWQKKVKLFNKSQARDDDSTTESEFENDYDDDDAEACELRSESVNSVLTKNTTIALYSSSNSLELFYLCKMIDFRVAIENMVDKYKCIIPQGSPYIECQYYQKQKETKSKIHYIQVTPKKVCLLDTGFMTISQFNWK